MATHLLPVFYAVLQLIVLMAVGYAARRLGPWSDQFFQGLNRLVVRVALPLYFAVRVGRTPLRDITPLLVMPVAAIAIATVGVALSVAVFSLLPYRGLDRRAGIAMSGFGNSGYMPLTLAEVLPLSAPVVAERFGFELPAVLIAAYLFVFSPILWSVGNSIMTGSWGDGGRFRLKSLISPPLVGILVGLGLSLLGLPMLLSRPALPFMHLFAALDRLSDVTLPLALISLGALIGGMDIPRASWGHYAGMSVAVGAVRFALIPGLFFLVLFLTRMNEWLAPVVLYVIFLEVHTPPATNFSLMVGDSGVNREHTAVSLLVTYLAYLMLMPVYLGLFLMVTR